MLDTGKAAYEAYFRTVSKRLGTRNNAGGARPVISGCRCPLSEQSRR
jgi:hypothetical protein